MPFVNKTVFLISLALVAHPSVSTRYTAATATPNPNETVVERAPNTEIKTLSTCPMTTYVNDDFLNPVPGEDPDGDGPAIAFDEDAFDNIQDGIDATCAGGMVKVSEGIYKQGSQISVTKDITIQGEDARATIVSGSHSHRVIRIAGDGISPTVLINGFTIRDGRSGSGGAGILNEGVLTVSDCTISDNVAGPHTVAEIIYFRDNDPNLDTMTRTDGDDWAGDGFEVDNTIEVTRGSNPGIYDIADIQGPVITLTADATVITSSLESMTVRVIDPDSGEPLHSDGAGIFNERAELTVEQSSISTNSANGNGGGLYNDGPGNVRMINCTVSGNLASTGWGGGIYVDIGSLTMTHITITDNDSPSYGEDYGRGGGVY